MMINFTEKIKQVIERNEMHQWARIFVTREDGVGLYDSIKDHSSSSLSALTSGMWQASEALLKMVLTSNKNDSFRLSFDTSSDGIFVLPLFLEDKKYYLGAIYSDCLNPGQLKHKISLIKTELEVFFKKNFVATPIQKTDEENQDDLKSKNSSVFKNKPLLKSNFDSPKLEASRDGFLFDEISDDEMDQLFFVGRS